MTLPPEMREALRQRAAVLVVGTGCGALVGQPGWRARLEALVAALPPMRAGGVRAPLERGAWATALVAARDRLGAQAAQVVAGMTIPVPDPLPAGFTALARVPWRAVITTGFDESWARALEATGDPPVVLSAGEPLVSNTQGRRLLVHVFGHADRPDSLCLAPGDLLSRISAPGLEGLVRDLARACSFLYVGFEPTDPDLEWLASRVLGPAARERPHFGLVTGQRTVEPTHFRGTFGLRPIAFGGSLEGALVELAETAATESAREPTLRPRPAPSPVPLAEPEPPPPVQPRATAPRPMTTVPPRTTGPRPVTASPPAPSPTPPSIAAKPASPPSRTTLSLPRAAVAAPPPAAPRPPAAPPQPPPVIAQTPPAPRAAPPPPPPIPPPPAASGPELRQSIQDEVDEHMEAERWAEASEGLRRLAELEPEPGPRAKLLHARAVVMKDLLDDRAGAIALLEQALLADPALVPAWDALEPLQRGGGDPSALRRSYARALQALGKSVDRTLAFRLWGGLAEVSWSALGDPSTAVAAFEAARTLDPDDEGPERALAALYLKLGPHAADKAAAAHQALAARAPDDPEPYRVLQRLWLAEGDEEKALWAAAVLQHLGEAIDHPTGPLRLSERPPTFTRRLTEPLWESLFHPEEDRVLSTLFAVLGPSLVAMMAAPQRLPPRGGQAVPAVDPSATRPSRATAGPTAADFAAAALAHVAHFLEVPPPALFLANARRPCTASLRAGWPGVRPALIVDRRFVAVAPEREILFELARTVARLRSPWLLGFGARAPAMLDVGLRAAYALGGDAQPEGRGKGTVLRLLRHVADERPDLAQAQVAALASELDHRADPPDLGRWLAAVELSAARAALAITGDLEAALRRVGVDFTRPGGLDPSDRVKDLLAFAVSEEHFSVRAALAADGHAGAAAAG